MELANHLYDALELKYKSEITSAKATLFISIIRFR